MPRVPFKRSWPKYVVSLLCCTALRFFPWRPPNVEPVLATVMPLSRSFGALESALFAALNIVLFDAFSAALGTWTITAAGTYALVAFAGHYYLTHVRGIWGYVSYAVIGTLFFDLVTGVLIGPLVFEQTFRDAFFGQIPFTVNHLLGNVVLAAVLSPILERWIMKNERIDVATFGRSRV